MGGEKKRKGFCGPNVGIHSTRLAGDVEGLEKAMANLWAERCEGQSHLNGGLGVMDLLFSEPAHKATWMGVGTGERTALIDLDDSHRAVAATVVQWLGTQVGRGFLDDAFRRAGYTMTYERVGGAKTGAVKCADNRTRFLVRTGSRFAQRWRR